MNAATDIMIHGDLAWFNVRSERGSIETHTQ